MLNKSLFLSWMLLSSVAIVVVWWLQIQQARDGSVLTCSPQEEWVTPCTQERKEIRRDWIEASGKKQWQLTAQRSSVVLGFNGTQVTWQEHLQGVHLLQQKEGQIAYTLVADGAEYLEGTIRLTGQVHLKAPWGEMEGDELEVLPISKKELLASLFRWRGHVHFRFATGEVKCEEAEFDGVSRRGRCFGGESVVVYFTDQQAVQWEMQAKEVLFQAREGQEEVEAKGNVYIRQRQSEEVKKMSEYEVLAAYAKYAYGEKTLRLEGNKQARVLVWDHVRETRMSAPYIVFTWKEKGAPPFVKAEGDVRFVFQEEEYQRWKQSVKTL